MPVITIFSPKYCREEEVARKVAEKLNYRLLGAEVIETASERFGTPADRLDKLHEGAHIRFRWFHPGERAEYRVHKSRHGAGAER